MPCRQKLVFAGLILAGFAMFVFAGLVSDGDGSDMSVSQNPAIDRIIPNRGDGSSNSRPSASTPRLPAGPAHDLARRSLPPSSM